MKNKLILCLMLILLNNNVANACSAFKIVINEKVYIGKNFDWYSSDGYVIKNNRNTEKYAYQVYKGIPVHWVSKFGSITFNQIGKEFPYGGINEKGLVVEQLWLSEAHYTQGNYKQMIVRSSIRN